MTDLATRTAAPLVAATSKRLGVDLPPAVTKAIKDAEALRAARREKFDAPNLAASVAAAIWAGKDPLASKDVQRALTALSLEQANIDHRLSTLADQHAAHALIEHADAVIETWRPAVQRADKALREFRSLAPGVDPLHPDAANSLSTQALTPWGRAREAAAMLEQLGKGWQALAGVGAAYIPQNGRPLIVADLSADQLHQLGSNPKCDAVVKLDVPLDLADTATYAARCRRLGEEQAAARMYEADAPQRARAERRRSMGVVVVP